MSVGVIALFLVAGSGDHDASHDAEGTRGQALEAKPATGLRVADPRRLTPGGPRPEGLAGAEGLARGLPPISLLAALAALVPLVVKRKLVREKQAREE